MATPNKKLKRDPLILTEPATPSKPSLAHLSVVDKLVRDFAGYVLSLKTDFLLGLPGANDPTKAIEARAAQLGDIVLGRDPAFDVQPCNSNNILGNRIRVLLPNYVIQHGDPGKALFMWLAVQVLNAGAAIDRGDDENSVKHRLGDVTDDVVARILGVK